MRASATNLMPPAPVHFSPDLLTRPPRGGIDVVSDLEHFAIVTYAIPPERLRPLVHPRFALDCIIGADGAPRALVSMVPFLDRDFHFARLPWPRFRFGQTNYRAYVIDRDTGERAAWFFGTTLDSWTVNVPRHLWQLPWYRGRTAFSCRYIKRGEKHGERGSHGSGDASGQPGGLREPGEPATGMGRYLRYRVSTRSTWAPARLALHDSGAAPGALAGFAGAEAAAVILTHPLNGVFYRRDGALGSYRVWHDRLHLTSGCVLEAAIGLFDRLGLVPYAEQANPHSVLMQRHTEFTIFLPPKKRSASPRRWP